MSSEPSDSTPIGKTPCSLPSQHMRVVVDEKAALDGVQVHLVHIDGGEQVLEHGGHELHVHAVGTKAVEHQERWMGKLLLMHAVPA